MSALTTWARWIEACVACGGSMNGIRDASGTWYYLDPRPRQLQNGALVGRAHRHQPGLGMVDVGAFKIAADGSVLQCPAEVAAALQLNSSEARKVSGIDHSPTPKDCALDDLERPSAMNSGDIREKPDSTLAAAP